MNEKNKIIMIENKKKKGYIDFPLFSLNNNYNVSFFFLRGTKLIFSTHFLFSELKVFLKIKHSYLTKSSLVVSFLIYRLSKFVFFPTKF